MPNLGMVVSTFPVDWAGRAIVVLLFTVAFIHLCVNCNLTSFFFNWLLHLYLIMNKMQSAEVGRIHLHIFLTCVAMIV